MFELRFLVPRRRKMLTRVGALLALGLGGLFAVLPRTDAYVSSRTAVADLGGKSFLLSPEPMSGERFSAFYALMHR